MNNKDEKPELIATSSGFSVFYKNKYLYSRYSPQKSVLNLIEQTAIPPETLVLCMSPLLGYGLSELLKKMPASSFAAAIEYDENLMELSLNSIGNEIFNHSSFFYIRTNSVKLFLKQLEQKIKEKKFRRVIRLDFSAGAALNKSFYSGIEYFTKEYISRYWINKLTLIQFGKNYALNIFKNYCAVLKHKNRFASLQCGSITKPILVAAAGPSLDCSLKFIEKNRKHLFVIAVDAAAFGLYPKIKPDAIIILESQYWIQKAFIGLSGSGIPVIADLTANPKAVQAAGGLCSFFFTDYADNPFFDFLENKHLLPLHLEPMGSVGLSALKIASLLAAQGTPIFHTGLDFSWGRGFTHSKAAFQVRSLFSECSKLHNLYCADNLFGGKVETEIGKNGIRIFTSPNLKSYAELYKHIFAYNPNFFDIGKTGLLLNSNLIDENLAETIICKNYNGISDSDTFCRCFESGTFALISEFLKTEKEKLLMLKAVFTHKVMAESTHLKNLLISVPYLYLHFADYSEENLLHQNFLNRIRIELEYFLKIFADIY